MTKQYKIKLRANDGEISTVEVIISSRPWTIDVPGSNRTYRGDDLFEALIAFRHELESEGAFLLCNGSRVDVFPSGMSRTMGGGRIAYIIRLGHPATETVDIFDEAPFEAI